MSGFREAEPFKELAPSCRAALLLKDKLLLVFSETSRYSLPCKVLPEAEIATSLDDALSAAYVTFWELNTRLSLRNETHGHDLEEQTKLNHLALVKTWKSSLLTWPQARAAEA